MMDIVRTRVVFVATTLLLQTTTVLSYLPPQFHKPSLLLTPSSSSRKIISYRHQWRRYLSNDPSVVSSTSTAAATTDDNNPLGLTPELAKITTAFQNIGDDKLRYKQLLYMANQLQPMDKQYQIPENKVPGCLSTVYLHAYSEIDESTDVPLIKYVGDSDGVLTKGLVALLIRGLSGNTAADIQKVDPQFIKQAGITASLTPGRNNGFLNMIAVMKRKAIELENQAVQQKGEESTEPATEQESSVAVTIYQQIVSKLQNELQPNQLELKDVSYQHAGHREAGDGNSESHFELYIVSESFTGLNLVKRHKLVYTTLGDIMTKIHALQIQAKTPSEIQ